jgi:16S rRNA A1518/A1519 N6-dimethyltransferase RsmA/KsgA/DIM1 with predicted DNA glycosylase/AP lyase activity
MLSAGCTVPLLLQEEVAQRLVDPTPARPDYRAMSVITHYYSKPVYRFL